MQPVFLCGLKPLVHASTCSWAHPYSHFQGVTLAKLQVAVLADSRGSSSLLGTLSRLSEEFASASASTLEYAPSTSSRQGAAKLAIAAVRALLAVESDWVGAALEGKRVGGQGVTGHVDDRRVQALFAEMSLDEHERIQQERAFGQWNAGA